MITAERMAAVDENAAELGVSQRQLMESSGRAVADSVRSIADPGARVAIVAGRGNNGGDGFVVPRFLEDYNVSVHLVGRADTITTDISRKNWEVLENAEYDRSEWRDAREIDLPSADVLVDAILGTGVSGEIREPAASAIEAVNESGAYVVSVDVPSGLDADTGELASHAVEPDHVVTFHDRKPGLNALEVPITVADIGIPSAAELFVGPGDLGWMGREAASHKGDAGHVLVIGGGPYTGAPALSGLAALRTGGDLATVACPSSIASTVQSYAPDIIVHAFSGGRLETDHTQELLEVADELDCVLIGPGLGDARESLRAVREFLRAYEGRCVVDADALQVVPDVQTSASVICTPHQGELEAMGGPRNADWRDRMEAVEAYADNLGHTILVKGAYDIVSNGSHTRVARPGNPGMTVGGTGDVLAGIVATIFAQRDDPLMAGSVGAYLNGYAGDLAAEKYGDSLIASDVVELIPPAILEAK